MPIDTSTFTAQQQAAAIYVAYYDRAPDPAGLIFWTNQIEAGVSLEEVATFFSNAAETKKKYPYFDTPELSSADAFITAVYLNLFNRLPDQDGLDFWTDQLESGSTDVGEIILAIIEGAQGDDIAVVENKVSVGLDWAESAADAGVGGPSNPIAAEVDGELVVYNEAAWASAGLVLDDVDETAASVSVAKQATDAFFAGVGVPGEVFTLTEGSDDIDGTAADDLILAGTSNIGSVAHTLGTGDDLDGGEGFDTLRIIDDAGLTFIPNASGIESVEVQALGGTTTVNMVNTSGVEQAWNYRSTSNVNYTNVQAAVVAGVFDSNTALEITYENGVDLGGAVDVVVDAAGVDSDSAAILINSDDAANLTDLNIMVGADSYLDIDVDSAAAPVVGTPANLETLTIAGEGGLFLREANDEGETDTLTSIDSTGLEGWLNLDLSGNDEDFVFVGGDGDTTLDADGAGDVNITTGAGDDWIDVDGSGDVTVDAGAGDDFVTLGANATIDDSVDGGEGVDTIGIDIGVLASLTTNDDFEAAIDGFEQVYALNEVQAGDTETIDLDNLDDIQYVITDGTAAGIDGTNEIQVIDFQGTGAEDGYVRIEVLGGTLDVKIPAGTTQNSVAQIVTNAVQTAINTNQLPAGLVDVTNPFFNGEVDFEFDSALGNIAPSVTASDVLDSASLTNQSTTNGVPPVLQQQTFAVDNTLPWVVADDNVAFSNALMGGGSLNVTIDGGSSIDEAGEQIRDAFNADSNSRYTATYDAATNLVTITAKSPGPLTQVVDSNGGSILTGAVSPTGVTPVAEIQSFDLLVNGSAAGIYAADGYLEFGNAVIEVPAGTDQDQLGALIVSNKAAIIAQDPSIADVDYDTATGSLTVEYSTTAGNVANNAFTSLFDGNANTTANPFFDFTLVQGDAGTAGGIVNLEYTAPGGTLELNGANLGTTNVIVDGAAGSDDEFSIVLATSDDHTGVVNVAGIETLNVMTEADGVQSILDVNAPDLVTLNVNGTSGVNFFGSAALANLETVDAGGLDIEIDEDGVWIQTDNVNGTTFNGSAGQDWFIGDDGDDVMTGGTGDDLLDANLGADVLDGGEGDDFLDGGINADVLTGGADADTFFYNNVADSQGTAKDTITDFASGEDKINFSAIEQGTGFYSGEANGYGAVLTSLQGTGDSQAVLDMSTSTLYVDVDGDGVLDNADMAIDLTGVTSLDGSTDFIW